jgi:hypothetical protein
MSARETNPAIRRLTVQSLVQRSGGRPAWHPHEYVRPWIRLSGKWLADAGFAERDAVVVRVAHGRLIIEKEQPHLPIP